MNENKAGDSKFFWLCDSTSLRHDYYIMELREFGFDVEYLPVFEIVPDLSYLRELYRIHRVLDVLLGFWLERFNVRDGWVLRKKCLMYVGMIILTTDVSFYYSFVFWNRQYPSWCFCDVHHQIIKESLKQKQIVAKKHQALCYGQWRFGMQNVFYL